MAEPAAATLEERRRRRAFALAHHPDRGGDTEAFVVGLAALTARRPCSTGDLATVHVYRRRRGLIGWLGLGRPRAPTRTLR